jgi:hypothetical protein
LDDLNITDTYKHSTHDEKDDIAAVGESKLLRNAQVNELIDEAIE